MSGGRRQSAGVLRAIRTQSEFWRQVARAAPGRGEGRLVVGGVEEDVGEGRGEYGCLCMRRAWCWKR